MKKAISLFLVCLLILSGFAGCAAADRYLSVGTGSVMGVYYPLGGTLSSLISDKLEGFRCSAEATGGAVENATLIQKGQLDLGFVVASTLYDAQNGLNAFAGTDGSQCLALFSFFPEVVQILSTDKNIRTIEDLKGKRVAVGQIGSGTETMARTILQLHGMSYADIEEDYLGFSDAASGLKDNTVDAAFTWAGIPTASVLELGTTHSISMVGFSDEKLEALTRQFPYCLHTQLTPDHYPSLHAPAQTFSIPAVVCASAALSEDFVYDLLAAVFDNLALFAQAHDRGGDLSLETALDGLTGIRLHPGAERFYRDKGLLD